MTDQSSGDRIEQTPRAVNRRQFIGVGAGVGVTLLAGCSTQSDSTTGGDDTTESGTTGGETTESGSFRLLISDQPVAIDDFDSLDVSFDRARIFSEQSEGDDEASDEADDQEANETEQEGNETEIQQEGNETEIQQESNETEIQQESNETEIEAEDEEPEDDESDAEEEDDSEESEDGEGGFSVIDLDGATVDLTQVVGDRAISVFDGELSAGTYSKLELYASNVDGIVGGESVDVTIPSGKLQIVKPFEITPEEPVSFVFDINVVKKGRNGGYNLLPVTSESGVAGKDVEVEEISEDRGGRGEQGGDEDGEDDEEAGDEEADDGDADTEQNDTAQNSTGEGRRPTNESDQ